jgi:hypothetical protein
LTGYAEGDCPASIRLGARTLASAYISMRTEVIPFAAPDDPEALNPIFGWQPGSSTASTYDLAIEPGVLTLIAGPGTNQWDNTDSGPLIAYPFEGDFEARVEVAFEPSGSEYKLAGLGVRSVNEHTTWLRVMSILDRGGNRLVEFQSV